MTLPTDSLHQMQMIGVNALKREKFVYSLNFFYALPILKNNSGCTFSASFKIKIHFDIMQKKHHKRTTFSPGDSLTGTYFLKSLLNLK